MVDGCLFLFLFLFSSGSSGSSDGCRVALYDLQPDLVQLGKATREERERYSWCRGAALRGGPGNTDEKTMEVDGGGGGKETGGGRLASWEPSLCIQREKKATVYDYCWYPGATVADDASFCFAVVRRGHPVHLYDGYGGYVRCSYVAHDEMEHVAPVYSVGFGDGEIHAGGKNVVYTFDVTRPGKECRAYKVFEKKQLGQPGIVSAIVPGRGALEGTVAIGSYSCVAGLHDVKNCEMICLLEGHAGGVTHMEFSADGNYLYTGARKDGALYCWDARMMTGAVYTINRKTTRTNQRIYFDIEASGRHLITGGDDGFVRVFDLRDGSEVSMFLAARDCVNGCAFHPSEPLIATSSGERRYYVPAFGAGDDSGDDDDDLTSRDGMYNISVWQYPIVWHDPATHSHANE